MFDFQPKKPSDVKMLSDGFWILQTAPELYDERVSWQREVLNAMTPANNIVVVRVRDHKVDSTHVCTQGEAVGFQLVSGTGWWVISVNGPYVNGGIKYWLGYSIPHLLKAIPWSGLTVSGELIVRMLTAIAD